MPAGQRSSPGGVCRRSQAGKGNIGLDGRVDSLSCWAISAAARLLSAARRSTDGRNGLDTFTSYAVGGEGMAPGLHSSAALHLRLYSSVLSERSQSEPNLRVPGLVFFSSVGWREAWEVEEMELR
eukprot:GFKZ01010013.1.p2 GENE.GFKZ01010013.1~~GFKZ01010013.1.p2  ORF type:complete len:125 (-),score=0.59 GFKZ01010013.1:1174-1548(-)